MTRLHELQEMLIEESTRPDKQEPTRLENILLQMVTESNCTASSANDMTRTLFEAVAVWQRRALVMAGLVWLLSCTLAFVLTR